MRIHRIHLQHVAGVDDRALDLADGVTVVVGPNETGKSTVATALQLLLEEKDRYDNERIRAVRPVHTDADPTVELECTTGPYHLTYRKVFGRTAGRRETSLVLHAPVAASLTGDDAHDRMVEILDETVDEQLWSALRVQQGHDVGQLDLTDAGSLMAALDAAGGGRTDHAGDDTLVRRVEDEAAVFWTGTGRPRKPLEHADARVEQARAAVDDASRRLAEAHEATARHDQLVARLAEWRAELPALELREKQATAQVDQLQQRRDAVEEAAATVRQAEEVVTRARDEREDRAVLLAKVEDAQALATQRQDDVAHGEQVLARAEDELAAARDARDELRDEVDDARGRQREAEDDVAWLRERRDCALLEDRIEEAERLHDQRQQARARLSTPAPAAAVVRRLERLADEVRTTAALLEAGVPRVAVDGPVGTPIRVDDGDVTVGPGGLELSVAEPLEVRVGDVTMTIQPGSSATELADRHTDARHALRRGLEDVGVKDVADARARREHERAARVELESTTTQWTRLTNGDGVDGLRASLDRARARVRALAGQRPADRPVPVDRDVADDAVRSARTEAEQLAAALATADAACDSAASTAEAARTAHAEARTRLASTHERLDELVRALAAAREQVADEQLDAQVEQAQRGLAVAQAGHRQATEQLGALDVAGIEADAQAARARLHTTHQRIADADLERARVWGAIESSATAGLGERVPELEAALADAEGERARIRHRATALLLLRETLHRHRDEARARYRAPLAERIEQLGRVVFGPDFAITLDDQLRIVQRTLGGRTLALDQLSGGAQEQLAIITRLAAASLVDDADGVPLILDDALGYADPARADRVNALLGKVGNDTQVIVLTCDPDRFAGVPGARVLSLD